MRAIAGSIVCLASAVCFAGDAVAGALRESGPPGHGPHLMLAGVVFGLIGLGFLFASVLD